jgi:class 3 adenylate cyclase
MRAAIYYFFSFVVLALYGGRVCSFIEGLSLARWSTILIVSLGATLVLRPLLERRVVLGAPPIAQPRRQFALDLGLFLTAGAAIGAYDRLAYGFALGSGLKMMLGCATLGFFGALDLALERERAILKAVLRAGERITDIRRRGSLTRKFAMVALLSTLLVTAILLLVVTKNVNRIARAGTAQEVSQARSAVLLEVGFVMAILTVLSIKLIWSYSRNLKLFFDKETTVLEMVTRDELEGYVPVLSRDEFGLIADRTNFMIDGLRERRRIKNVFGKVVSPEIARRLLAEGDGEIKLGGSRRNVVLLFSDIRNFTALTERMDPEALVRVLNRYFSKMVELVRAEGGLVDKFIGDGILAVFGLDNPVQASLRAVRTAQAMQAAVGELGGLGAGPLEIGIGIHRGDVIAGAIGSPERLEFTFIGDAVNTASRLEGLSKPLKVPIVISLSIYEDLRDAPLLPWKAFGPQALRGKLEPVSVFGLASPFPPGQNGGPPAPRTPELEVP